MIVNNNIGNKKNSERMALEAWFKWQRSGNGLGKISGLNQEHNTTILYEKLQIAVKKW